VAAAAGLALALSLATVVVVRGAYPVLGVESTHPEQAIMLYDLAQLSVREGELLYGPEYFPSQRLDSVREVTHPLQLAGVYVLAERGELLSWPLPADVADELRGDWLSAVRRNVGEWLSMRWEMYSRTIGLSGPTWWVYQTVSPDNPPEHQLTMEGPTKLMWEYLDVFTADPNPTGGPLHRVWVYLVLTAVAAWRLLRHGWADPPRRLLGLLGVVSLLYNATWFVGAMEPQYRFVYPNVVFGVVVVLGWIGLDVVPAARRRWSGVAAGDPGQRQEEAAEEQLQADHHAGGARDDQAELAPGVEVPEVRTAPAGERDDPAG